jgi:hypothetical protein
MARKQQKVKQTPAKTVKAKDPETETTETDPNLAAIRFLHESGLLFKINQEILHPHGLGLEADISDEGACSGWKPMTDKRDDPVGVLFVRADFKAQRSRFLEYMRTEGADKLKERNSKLGFVVQDESNR